MSRVRKPLMLNESHSLTLFYWKGISLRDGRMRGAILAHSLTDVREQLAARSILLLRVAKETHHPFFARRLKGRDITRLCRQFSTLLAGGIPLLSVFELTRAATRNNTLKQLLVTLSTCVSRGMGLAEAMRAHPHCFDAASCSLIQVGERSATLAGMFDRIATEREKTERLRRAIVKALAYPVTVMIIAFVVSVGLLTFVVPEFERMFAHFGTELPLPTRTIVSFSHFLTGPSFKHWIIPGLFSVCTSLMMLRKNPRVCLAAERMGFAVPGAGPLFARFAGMRLASLLATTMGAGIPLSNALEDIAQTTRTSRFQTGIKGILSAVQRGESLSASMQKSGLFEEHLLVMVRTGEDAGTLQSSLHEAGLWLEAHLEHRLEILSNLIEPFIMAILGLLVGGLVVALYLPVLTLGRII